MPIILTPGKARELAEKDRKFLAELPKFLKELERVREDTWQRHAQRLPPIHLR